ncbi:PaaI family thioesterase [Salimicrobium humidisoli]|uniref:Medium/long-chain acyl-CoA thioesterase YigI n=1 Tax=Salimicrobium humidisoli TaxID=2029857 RepID=A0ABX4HR94_9BACI|nr:PaaI family thioesterase [Salimicrobium humidisoli]PBB05721.1 phenylacetic acid degradation protein [Salimicrobium humidisoli]
MGNNDFFDRAEQALKAQTFSQLVGTELKEYKPGEVVLEIPIKDNLLQQHKFVHGGVVSYAADNALTFAGGSTLGPNVLTSEYKINYVRPAFGEKLIARASVIYSGKRQAVCRCDVFVQDVEGEEKLCATSQGTIVSVSS